MKLAITTVFALSILASSSVLASPAQGYLAAPDQDAIDFFKCAASVGATREMFKLDGFDVFSNLPETFDKAGRAAVIKAVLVARENNAKPTVKNISFTSKRASKLVATDIAANRKLGSSEISMGDFEAGLSNVSACIDPDNLARARSMVKWLDEDVSLFGEFK